MMPLTYKENRGPIDKVIKPKARPACQKVTKGLEIAKTRQIVNPGFGFESRAKPGFRVWVSGLETHTIFIFPFNK